MDYRCEMCKLSTTDNTVAELHMQTLRHMLLDAFEYDKAHGNMIDNIKLDELGSFQTKSYSNMPVILGRLNDLTEHVMKSDRMKAIVNTHMAERIIDEYSKDKMAPYMAKLIIQYMKYLKPGSLEACKKGDTVFDEELFMLAYMSYIFEREKVAESKYLDKPAVPVYYESKECDELIDNYMAKMLS